MKRFGIVSLTVIVVLVMIASTATATNTAAHKSVVIDFLHQFIDHATSPDMPQESRITTAIAAAHGLATALGVDIDDEGLKLAARDPQVFAPESDTVFTWSGGVWQAYSRNTYNYSSGKKNSIRTDNWTGTWSNFSLTSWTYNGSNQISTYTYQTWNGGNSTWSNNLRTTLSYDGSNRLSTMMIETWMGSDYAQSSQTVYTYDGSSRIATITSQTWVGIGWMDLARTTFTYDGNGNEILALSETYLGTWSNSSRTTSTYTGNLLATEITEQWNGSGWSNYSKDEYIYDGSDNQTLDRRSTWQASAWTVAEVDTSKYDGSDRLIQSVQWQVSPSILTKQDYTYNGSGNMVLMIGQSFSSSWDNTSKTVITYTTLATKVEGAHLPKDFALMQNHPNPFNPTTTIRYNLGRSALVTIEIHNVLGQLVRILENSEQSAGVYETTWDGRNESGREVASGVYFYSLKAGDFTETRKMVLSR